jgi:hypothetical protein
MWHRRGSGDNRRVPDAEMPDAEMPDAEMEAESRATDRLTLFSDAVVAIAITLLAIDLPVPEGGTVPLFWESVRHNGGHYAAFLISFFAIAAAWRDHHDIFKYVRRVDSRLRTLNTFWLLMIVLNPFATKLLTAPGHPDLQTRPTPCGSASTRCCRCWSPRRCSSCWRTSSRTGWRLVPRARWRSISPGSPST